MKKITIGRSSTCDIIVEDQNISRVHAEIFLAGNQYVFKDISKNGSTLNGVYINNEKVVISPGANVLLANRIPLPWGQIYSLLPIHGARPYSDETSAMPVMEGRMPSSNSIPNEESPNNYNNQDSLGIGWGILALLFPLIGFILYFVWKSKTPHRAAQIAGWAWGGVVINLLISLF